jgi:hypothetical protein
MVEGVMDGLDLVCERLELFDRPALEEQVMRFRSGESGFVNNLWILFFLVVWLERWMVGLQDKDGL